MEIERKFLVKAIPDDLSSYPFSELTQAYLNRSPVVRIRKADDAYELTYKGGGMMAREEYNLPLNQKAFEHLLEKADGRVITKRRYRIPYGSYVIELDIFHGDQEGLVLAEVEFPSIEEAMTFRAPDWFAEDVTNRPEYHNSHMVYGQ